MKLLLFARILLLIIFTISLISIAIFSVVLENFKNVSSMQSFLVKANAYQHISDIIKLEVKAYYPPLLANNFLLFGITNKLLDFVVTPNLVEQVSGPALKLAYGFAKSPTEIVQDKVVLNTAVYKNQVKQGISEVGLPGVIVVNANYLVDNLPKSLTLVDLERHPNSVLGVIIKLRTAFKYAQNILSVSYVLLIVSTFFMIVLNLHRLKFMVKEFFIGIAVSGIGIFVLSVVLPGVISMNLPDGGALLQAQNGLVLDAVNVILGEIRIVSYIYIGVALVLLFILLFIHFEKLQLWFDRKLKRVHIPQISVKIT